MGHYESYYNWVVNIIFNLMDYVVIKRVLADTHTHTHTHTFMQSAFFGNLPVILYMLDGIKWKVSSSSAMSMMRYAC